MQHTDHAVETEIKLRLSPEARVALERHPLFNPPRASEPHTVQEVTTYFDTPDLALVSKGVSLRVRRSGQGLKQTVKVTGVAGQDPLQRGEWEWPLESDTPDLGRLVETPVASLVQTLETTSLRPVFTTDVRRTSCLLQPDECSTIEAAFDEGAIIADASSGPISEMELELKAGDAHALYQLALELLKDIPLGLEVSSKAERGFWLRTGKPPKASKAAHINIDGSICTGEAFKHIVGAALVHLLADVGPAERADIEGVHQIRVAVRRLRAALALFKPHLPPVTLSRFNDELRRLAGTFGRARDWDVFVYETLPAAKKSLPELGSLHELGNAAEEERAAAHRAVSAELCTPDFARLVVGIAAWTADRADNSLPLGDETLTMPIEETASDLLDRMWRKVAKRGRHMDQASREQLHALRKAIKKLRYSVEFLSALYKHKRVKAYLGPCEDLQKILGAVNDAAVTPALVEQLRGAVQPTIGALSEWATSRSAKARRHVFKPWHELRAADRFWR